MKMAAMMMNSSNKPQSVVADASARAEGASSMREIMVVTQEIKRQNRIEMKLLGLVPVGATTMHGSVPVE